MGLSNDERGWVMTILSGVACVVGASVICVDIIVRQFPGQRNFRIQDSDTFLSVSLSLSFGVMLYSALNKMLPSAKNSLQAGGFTPKQAAWVLVACFLGGVIGIQVISRILHSFMPSHVVDCEHTHDEEPAKEDGHSHENGHAHDHSNNHKPERLPPPSRKSSLPGHLHRGDSDWRPSSRRSSYLGHINPASSLPSRENGTEASPSKRPGIATRPSLSQRLTSSVRQLTSGRNPSSNCGEDCYGYSEPCGQDCFKTINARGGYRAPKRLSSMTSRPALGKSATTQNLPTTTEETPLLRDLQEDLHTKPTVDPPMLEVENGLVTADHPQNGTTNEPSINGDANGTADLHKTTTSSSQKVSGDVHHHHVPSNAFLSIGLQTSIAIALHKLPEGFITYATNHANPKLGVAVFLALFIHNITEGFAMALPLYLAINSRLRAMLISFVLGGLSQPIGAGVAALWFKLGDWKGEGWKPSEGVYGGMFAVTAGIMASVALQLFSESLDLTHSRTLCMIGAFTGMGILGISSALTA
ncbi:hypothetical protein BAUCODRAFT_120112 [Baudoinia panamericana UAMH 10762]|uniref:Zinc/iron permease n=1 Tax=Baudoinia panamericana (strain UAMH 10762) TaxID=717646 RepID=M2NI98_BAUPA|nr:uncharacterized protein BAUCODRAFT_120112 [Baudoinia panamericana UAMH 10762]EMC98815.1 hypothetical protein BAUCODRAFT_120112 [Baudoinia panamericana UAMH 10762]